ncbi:hypothetical protein BDF20DRAFT_699321 [Mycotypha africana]|uniref:uncharacterized protein n=1 Tax=Mycotypha africana TaxID=64632 RepID=UPI002300F05D|nr:uncharacterized protein BDF20DRAFT_699321 [Mycotypha africana]KAI8971797.1 hypothetical protein BDF20DRAFT_699321 [Mycotypha africana]
MDNLRMFQSLPQNQTFDTSLNPYGQQQLQQLQQQQQWPMATGLTVMSFGEPIQLQNSSNTPFISNHTTNTSLSPVNPFSQPQQQQQQPSIQQSAFNVSDNRTGNGLPVDFLSQQSTVTNSEMNNPYHSNLQAQMTGYPSSFLQPQLTNTNTGSTLSPFLNNSMNSSFAYSQPQQTSFNTNFFSNSNQSLQAQMTGFPNTQQQQQQQQQQQPTSFALFQHPQPTSIGSNNPFAPSYGH